FLYLAKYPVHTTETLDQLEASLQEFHDNRNVFVVLGIRNDFNLPKLHFLGHYRELFEIFGTSDNFDTQYTERLHIDMAKNAYRSTNSKDEYPQMTAWLDRRERILYHEKFLKRRLDSQSSSSVPTPGPPSLIPTRTLRMASSPVRSVTFDELGTMYGTKSFSLALAKFIVQFNNPSFSKREIASKAKDLHIPFNKVPVFHRAKFVSTDPLKNTTATSE
ncbi:hypothetical protein BKA70DRAFT_1103484, partial [Coprinopsis sp. MPI-PUGE-AT-0042]